MIDQYFDAVTMHCLPDMVEAKVQNFFLLTRINRTDMQKINFCFLFSLLHDHRVKIVNYQPSYRILEYIIFVPPDANKVSILPLIKTFVYQVLYRCKR